MKQHNWDVDPQHPDLTPQHEALLLFERLTELQRLPTMAARPPEFRELVDESRTQARLLQSLLNSPGAGETAASIPTETKPGSVLQTLRRLCRECHQRFRDCLWPLLTAFDLPHPLTSQSERFTDFLQRSRFTVVQTKSHSQDRGLA